MNTEKQKTRWRFAIYILFWAIIVCLGFLLAPHGGTGTGGPGTGSGAFGSGTGRGQGNSGQDAGSGGSGSSEKAQVDGPKNAAPPAQKAAGTPEGKVVPKPARSENPNAPLRILSQEAASEDTATIFLPVKSTGSGAASGTSTGFFGVEITGSAIFLLDVSGSMASSGNEGRSRLDLVKLEMEKTLKSKFEEARRKKTHDHFRIVSFSSGCTFFPDEKSSAYKFSDVRKVGAAIDFVKNLSPGGGTSMKLAWDAITPFITQEEIKSVYFLSDGDPTDCTAETLLAQLKATVPQLTIHTISMGQSSELLRQVAKQHHGQYREVF